MKRPNNVISFQWWKPTEVLAGRLNRRPNVLTGPQNRWESTSPLEKDALWTEFALEKPTEADVLKLCRRHGFLTRMPRPDQPAALVQETVGAYRTELRLIWLITEMLNALRMAESSNAHEQRSGFQNLDELIPEGKVLFQSAVFNPFAQLVLASSANKPGHPLGSEFADEGLEDDAELAELARWEWVSDSGPLPTDVFLHRQLLAEKGVRPEDVGFKRRNMEWSSANVKAVRAAALSVVNSKVGLLQPGLLLGEDGQPHFTFSPQTLLSALWLQIALHETGVGWYWRCQGCGKLSPGQMGMHKDRQHCDSSKCKKASYRARKNQTAAAQDRPAAAAGASIP